MTTMKTHKILAALLLGGALSAQSTFYVDAVNGRATNNGTKPSTAFRSITQGAAAVKKGGTIVVLPGKYDINVEGAFPILFNRVGNVTIIAAEGPSKTFIDGGGAYSGIGMVRFRELAPGCRLTGFTFRNMADAFWSCGIRLGSSSGNQFRCVDIEIDNCVFESTLSRAFVLFGAGAGARQSTGMRIHNNLIIGLHSNRRSVEMDGDGDNWFYNNVVIHSTGTINRAAIFIQSIVVAAPAKPTIKNNIVMGGGTNSWGIEMGTNGQAATIMFNNSVGNKINYANLGKVAVPHASNMSVKPDFVDITKGNYRLQPISKMIDAGTANLPLIRHDPDGFPHLFPFTNKGRLPDIGAYELHRNDFVLATAPRLGGKLKFTATGKAGLVGVFFGINESAFRLPFGVALIDTLLQLGITSSPGSFEVNVPKDPSLEGFRFTVQALNQDLANKTLEFGNVTHLYVAK